MTLDEFLVELEKTPRDWYLVPKFGMIRRGCVREKIVVEVCPIIEIYGKNISNGMYPTAAKNLGLDVKLAHQIARTADNFHTFDFVPELRIKLLKACGLEESNV